MKIGIIGTGNMGRTLGIRWAECGHRVFFGGRDIGKIEGAAERARAAGATNVQSGTNRDAAEFGEVVFYSPRDIHPRDVIGDVALLDGKIVLDPANEMPSRPDTLNYQNIETVSLAERLQARIPAAHVVKAFNTMSQETVTQPTDFLRAQGVSCYIAGDDVAARAIASGLADELGFVSVDCGGLDASRHLEAIARFIIYLMGERGLGSGATINVHTLPDSPNRVRYGDREADRSYS